jgi:uncharacterized membrane protein
LGEEKLGVFLDSFFVWEDSFEIPFSMEFFIKLKKDVPIFRAELLYTVLCIQVNYIFSSS